jgi:5'-nucleotidase
VQPDKKYHNRKWEGLIMLNRREFLKRSSTAGAILLLPGWIQELGAAKLTPLIILHTNDIHSHIDPFPDNDPKFAGQGGLSKIAQLVNEWRKQHPNVLLLDSGDVFQGTPYFNRFAGKPEFELMTQMGYAASTPGNHDFDNGAEGFANMLPYAGFPFLNANYNFSGSPLAGKIEPYKIQDVNGIKVGLFGIGIELNGLVSPKHYGSIVYSDPYASANNTARLLKKELRCDIVICLSHLGYSYAEAKPDDKKLAAASENIDLILGGHTHTFLEAPQVLTNRIGKNVTVHQAGWGGLRLGRVEFGLR